MERKRKRAETEIDHIRGVRAKTDLPSVATIYNHFLYEYPIHVSILENAPLEQILSLRRLSKTKKNQIDIFLRTKMYRKWNLPEENLIYEIGRLTFFGFNKDEDIPSQCEKMNIVLGSERVEGKKVYLSVPEGINTIRPKEFEGRRDIIKVWLPPSVKTIASDAFGNCDNLTKIKLSPNLEKIGRAAFMNCKKLKKVRLSERLTTIGPAAFILSGIEQINLPRSLRTIDTGAFTQCPLEEISFPASLEYIARVAFSSTKLKVVRFPPEARVLIEKTAFWNSPIETVYCSYSFYESNGDKFKDVAWDHTTFEFYENSPLPSLTVENEWNI